MNGHTGNDIIVYSGFPKTASKWLLHSVWRGKGAGFKVIAEGRAVARDFIENNPLDFDIRSIRDRYAEQILKCSTCGEVPVIHHEGIAASLFGSASPNTKSFEQIAAVFPNSRVILAVREQRNLLLSWYAHNVKLGLGASLAEFLTETEPGVTPYLRFDVFKFHHLVRFLYGLYGRERVLILPYELLKLNPGMYLDRIMTFTGSEDATFTPDAQSRNVGLNGLEVRGTAWLNRRFATDHPLPRPSIRGRARLIQILRYLCKYAPEDLASRLMTQLEKQIESHVGNRYADSNLCLQQLTGLDLASYGYDISTT